MKIAYLVPYVPNLIRTRPYNLIVQLASLGHEVEVFTLGSGRQDQADAHSLRMKSRAVQYQVLPVWHSLWNCIAALPSRRPFQSVYSWHSGLARELAGGVSRNEFDIVHVEHLRGSRYGAFIKSTFPDMPVVWDSVDCISHLFQQAAEQSRSLTGRLTTRLDLARTRGEEGRLICRFDQVLVTSSTDREALLELAPRGVKPSPIAVLPNGVDLDYFRPNRQVGREPASIVFSGKMSYHANVSMVKYLVSEIMPRVWEARPETCLYIVGKDPPPDIKTLGVDPRITVTGTVTDIRPFLWRASMSVVPLLYGAGIQNKILEAMATGTPVVAAPRALSALQAQPGRDILSGEDAAGFAREILRLLADPRLRDAIGEAGLSYVRANHDWPAIASRLVDIYRETRDKDKVPAGQH